MEEVVVGEEEESGRKVLYLRRQERLFTFLTLIIATPSSSMTAMTLAPARPRPGGPEARWCSDHGLAQGTK